MSKEAATTEELASLHKAVAETLVADLTVKTDKDDDVELKIAKIKLRHEARAHAITFLKNNNITAAQGNADLDALQAALNKQRSQRTPGKLPQSSLDEAAELFAARNLQ